MKQQPNQRKESSSGLRQIRMSKQAKDKIEQQRARQKKELWKSSYFLMNMPLYFF